MGPCVLILKIFKNFFLCKNNEKISKILNQHTIYNWYFPPFLSFFWKPNQLLASIYMHDGWENRQEITNKGLQAGTQQVSGQRRRPLGITVSFPEPFEFFQWVCFTNSTNQTVFQNWYHKKISKWVEEHHKSELGNPTSV